MLVQLLPLRRIHRGGNRGSSMYNNEEEDTASPKGIMKKSSGVSKKISKFAKEKKAAKTLGEMDSY